MFARQVERIRGLRNPGTDKQTGIGVVPEPVSEASVAARFDEMGDNGTLAGRLDEAVVAKMSKLQSLSPLSAPLAINYLERIQHPISALGLPAGVFVTTRGYVAHLVFEADPGAYGADDVPVLGTLPPLRRGRPPSDLLTRAVKATRRGFTGIRGLNEEIWDGFALVTAWRVHGYDKLNDGALGHLDPVVVEGLVRFGWVLRQVDLHYGLEPEPAAPA